MIDPQPISHSTIAEWVKILISAGVGFFLGMVGDLIKTSYSDKRKQKRIKKALYTELAFLHSYVSLSIEVYTVGNLKAETFATIIRTLKRNAYDAAVGQPDVFHQLKEAPYIMTVYTILEVLDSPTAPAGGAMIVCQNFIKLVDEYVEKGYLPIKQFPNLSHL
jgi:hypothetical protein